MKVSPYIKVLRFNYWFKNLVTVFGFLAALAFLDLGNDALHTSLFRYTIATLFACLISAANYILNEITDKDGDSHHPVKKDRPLVNNLVSQNALVTMMITILSLTFLAAFFAFNIKLGFSLFMLFIAGIFYNLKPLRFKDIAYIDVISESVNNPIRILIGWFAIAPAHTYPPVAYLILFWLLGAFLMTVKRYRELNFLTVTQGKDKAQLYRNSYKIYTLTNLRTMIITYSGSSVLLVMYHSAVYPETYPLLLLALLSTYIWFLMILRGYQV